ncbi:PaaI family thioesterase [Leucobacter rhizosphaerae]|uniref:PaaI family thioesterase n=1 Tax=Leucobacter rhizosphaerae TaxID=2932245 RepID=A0ABY4FUY0_9MICO|nr:PaaI family thioesterase [Leucobacter rhizosphaerae]UOQ60046.1 PaaI family thioesterase [Leucobacter rhizosphaerae]
MHTNTDAVKTVLGELDERLGIEFVRVNADHAIATMPVAGNRQITGSMHGGAYCTLAETLASLAACEHAGNGRTAVGLDISATHTGRAAEGRVTATCRAIHLGRTVAVYAVEIDDALGHRVSTARVTTVLRDS